MARGHIERLRSGGYRAVVYAGIDPVTRKQRYLKQTCRDETGGQTAATTLWAAC